MKISENTRTVYDTISSIPDGGIVYVGTDFDVSYRGEMQAMLEDLFKHLFTKDVKVVSITFHSAPLPGLVEGVITKLGLKNYGKIYGVDYVNLGYYPGREQSVVTFGEDVHAMVKFDYFGTPIDELPLMDSLHSAKDFSLVISLTGGEIFPEVYLRQWKTKYNIKVTGGATSMIYPTLLGYVASGQLSGYLASSRGAAEYELLLNKPGSAIVAMDSQSIGHFIMIGTIILCNIGFIVSKLKSREGGTN
jgi:hypothetical protein